MIKKLTLLAFILCILSCTQKQDKKSNVQKPDAPATTSFATPRMTLVGATQQAALTWKDYQEFVTQLENYDHKKGTTDRLIELLNNAESNIPEALNEQPVRSRIVVAKSKLGTYRSYLSYTNQTNKEQIKRYNAFILAWDQLTTQLNEKLTYDQLESDLLDKLQGDFQQIADSINTP